MGQHTRHRRSVNAKPVPHGSPTTDLVYMIDRGGEPQAAAFEALCGKGDPEALRAILDFSHSEDWRLRRLVAEHLGHWVGNRAALSRLREFGAGDTSEYVVRTATEQLALAGDPASRRQALGLALNGSGETQLTGLQISMWLRQRLPVPGVGLEPTRLFRIRGV